MLSLPERIEVLESYIAACAMHRLSDSSRGESGGRRRSRGIGTGSASRESVSHT
jgi:hypothetical protein